MIGTEIKTYLEEYFAICDALKVSLEKFADREAGMELDFETLVLVE